MSVVDLRPHTICRYIYPAGSINEDGDYEAYTGSGTAAEYDDGIPCLAVPAGKDDVITGEDGRSSRIHYTVSLDPSVADFSVGDRVLLVFGQPGDAGARRVELSVLGFNRHQIHSRLWL